MKKAIIEISNPLGSHETLRASLAGDGVRMEKREISIRFNGNNRLVVESAMQALERTMPYMVLVTISCRKVRHTSYARGLVAP